MTPLGLGIVGTGNIAGGYARDAITHPEIRLVAATDLQAARASEFAAAHGCRAHETLDDLLADPEVDIVVNLTVHHAHYDVTKRALDAGKHVYSEKPLALRPDEARDLVDLATKRGLRLGCSPSTFLGEAQQTAAATIERGDLGTVRAIYADVNWGRIESWHPAPAPFYDVGVLVDVGVYPLTLVTSMFGPARAVRAWGWELLADRTALDGSTFRIGSPDLIVAAVELESGPVVRLTASFYVGRPTRQHGTVEFHGDDASLLLGSFETFDASLEIGALRRRLRGATACSTRLPRHGVGPRRRRDGLGDRDRPAASSERRAGRPRRRYPRGRRRLDGGSGTARAGHIVVRTPRAPAVGDVSLTVAPAGPSRCRPGR